MNELLLALLPKAMHCDSFFISIFDEQAKTIDERTRDRRCAMLLHRQYCNPVF
jgi:hypothetical protein